MAFAKKTWKDRIAEFPTRRRLTKEDNTSELVTVAREEGTLSQEGDAFSAENMNDLENRIDAEFTEVNGKLMRMINLAFINKKTLTVTLSSGGNVSIGINKARPIFGIYTDTSAGGSNIALIPYSISASTDWYIHAVNTGNNEAVGNLSINVTIYYGEVQ